LLSYWLVLKIRIFKKELVDEFSVKIFLDKGGLSVEKGRLAVVLESLRILGLKKIEVFIVFR